MKKKSIKFEEVYGKYKKYAIGYMQGKIFRALKWDLTEDKLKTFIEEIIDTDSGFTKRFKYSIIALENNYNLERRTYAILPESMLNKINEYNLNK